jgi:hypothetical protein
MKKLIYLLLIILITSCAGNKQEDFNKLEVIQNADVHIIKVFVAKYSKVIGCINYKGIILEVDNGNTGYYHKKYNLVPGQVIKTMVIVYQKNVYNNDPYKSDVMLSTSDIDVSQYEIH